MAKNIFYAGVLAAVVYFAIAMLRNEYTRNVRNCEYCRDNIPHDILICGGRGER